MKETEKLQAARTQRARTEPFTLRRLPQTSSREVWEVTNGARGSVYQVTLDIDAGRWECSCPDFVNVCVKRGINCKHIEAILLYYRSLAGYELLPETITVIEDGETEISKEGGAKMKNGNGNGRIRIASTITQKAFFHVEDALSIGKVRLFAGNYEAGKGATAMVSHYLDWDTALAVFHRMLTGSKDDSFKSYGGSSKNGQVVSRTCKFDLKFTEGKVFIVVAEGPGKKTSTGAIQPAGKPTTSVTIALTPWQAAALAARVCAYLFGKGASIIEVERAETELPEADEDGVEAEPETTDNGSKPATEKQVSLIFTLLRELGYKTEEKARKALKKRGYDPDNLSREQASELIERLKKAKNGGK